MFNKLKQIKDLRDQAKELQNMLGKESVVGEAAHGKVKVTMNGNQEVTLVEISDEILGNKSDLESAVKEATNDAVKKVQKVMAKKMQAMGGLDKLGLG